MLLPLLAAIASTCVPSGQSSTGWIGHGPGGGWMQAVLVSGSPGKPSYVNSETVYESLDGGGTWCPLAPGAAVHPVWLSGVAGTTPPSLFAASLDHLPNAALLYRSTDDGATWGAADRGLAAADLAFLTVDFARPGRLAIAGRDSMWNLVTFWSEDAGSSWSPGGSGLAGDMTQLAWVPDTREGEVPLLLAATTSGLYRSEDRGVSWTPVAGVTQALSIDVEGEGATATILVADASRLIQSNDGGRSFAAIASGLWNPSSAIFGPPAPESEFPILIVSGQLIFRSTNLGTTWTPSAGLPANARLGPLTPDDSDRRTIFSGTYRSTDGGLTWGESDVGFGNTRVVLLGIAPSDPRVVYAELDDSGIRKSTDGGYSWFNPSGAAMPGLGVDAEFIPGLAVSPDSPDVVVMGGTDDRGQLATVRSTDGGATWVIVAAEPPSTIAFDPRDPRHLVGGFLAESPDGFIGESRDGGASWEMYPAPAVASVLEFDRSTPGALRGVFYEWGFSVALYRSTDSGHTWQLVGPLPSNIYEYGAAAFDRNDPAMIYTTIPTDTGRAGLSKSSDGGLTWVALDGGLDALQVGQEWFPQVLLDPNDDRHIVVLGQTIPFPELDLPTGSIYESFDGGESWADATPDLPPSVIGPLAFGSDGRLFASVRGSGVYFRSPSRRGAVPPSSQTPRPPISGRP
jgi:photosystem II stability/assembly factor-like uncharacterized protein